jgi:GntR family transcriptional repressor for pyruvate dehydrogenase complex
MLKPDSSPTSAAKPKKRTPQRNRVYHNIFEELQQRIRQGEWLPGERIPSITQLAKEFNVGAGSIREALRSLQSIGLVKIEHGSGVFVLGTRPATELSSHFQNVGDGLILALAEARRLLEPELASLAAERATDEELLEIENIVHQMEENSQHGKDFADLDVQFHRSIARAARNPILFQTMEGVSDLFLESRRAILIDPDALVRALRYHILLAEALKLRNPPQARLLMQGHMNSMFDEVLLSETRKKSKAVQ